jgi:hypothetical protein
MCIHSPVAYMHPNGLGYVCNMLSLNGITCSCCHRIVTLPVVHVSKAAIVPSIIRADYYDDAVFNLAQYDVAVEGFVQWASIV